MRRASKRFWLLVSLVVVAALTTQAGLRAGGPRRVNEVTLAGLRPGHDKVPAAMKEFRDLERDADVTDGYVWGDICTHRELRVEAGCARRREDRDGRLEVQAGGYGEMRGKRNGSGAVKTDRERPRIAARRCVRADRGNLREGGIAEPFREGQRQVRIIFIRI